MKKSLEDSINFFNTLSFEKREGCELLSYTPLDNNFVYNANALDAYAMMRLYDMFGEKSLRNRAIRIGKGVVKNQKNNGAWEYRKNSKVIDNFHTGFTIEYLHRAKLPEKVVKKSINKGMKYYIDNLFYEDGRPKFKTTLGYPIDIHAAAESIIVFSLFRKNQEARTILDWTNTNLRNPDGSFGYRIYPFIKTSYPFMRWSQTWMLRAISEYILMVKN